MISFFVCTVSGDSYSHATFDTREAADADAASKPEAWVIATEGGVIVDARFDTPGNAIRAVKRVLKWGAI
jgi:hypothetical protein